MATHQRPMSAVALRRLVARPTVEHHHGWVHSVSIRFRQEAETGRRKLARGTPVEDLTPFERFAMAVSGEAAS